MAQQPKKSHAKSGRPAKNPPQNPDRSRSSSRKKNAFSYSPEYIAYVENGESTAVFIARDLAEDLDTRGKWIDVVNMFTSHYSSHGNWHEIREIIVELFPRRTKPDYSKAVTLEDKRYLTWQTANQDIEYLRNHGYHGPQYIIHPEIIRNPNRKYHWETRWWNPRFDRYVPKEWGVEGCEKRRVKVYTGPKWVYSVRDVRKSKKRYKKDDTMYILNWIDRELKERKEE